MATCNQRGSMLPSAGWSKAVDSISVLLIRHDHSHWESLPTQLAELEIGVVETGNMALGIDLAIHERPDALIVELTPPDLNPLCVAAAIRGRAELDQMCILFAVPQRLNSEMVELDCLSSGADGVISLPLHLPVVVARIKAAVRRSRLPPRASTTFQLGRLTVDHRQRRVTIDDSEVRLTPSEYEILLRLAQQPGRIYDRTELIGHAKPSDPLASGRTVDVHVHSLRRKLGALGRILHTVKGEGYCVRCEQQ